jgi:hypothetical protein
VATLALCAAIVGAATWGAARWRAFTAAEGSVTGEEPVSAAEVLEQGRGRVLAG